MQKSDVPEDAPPPTPPPPTSPPPPPPETEKTEKTEEKVKYPKGVIFILGFVFLSMFSGIGKKTVLPLYLSQKLGFSDYLAITVFHVIGISSRIVTLIGAFVADSYLGQYKSILYFSIIGSFGQIIVFLGSFPMMYISHLAMLFTGKIINVIGISFYAACVNPFAGDQFVLPQHAIHLERFFIISFFIGNMGAFCNAFGSPAVRQVKCFDENDCFPLVYGVITGLAILAFLFFLCGTPLYKKSTPESRNLFCDTTKVIVYALYKKAKSKNEKRNHWLDHAEGKYDPQFISDAKRLLMISVIFLPTIFFWALYYVQETRWGTQAGYMNNVIGSITLSTDILDAFNPVLSMILLPIYDFLINPVLRKLKLLQTPLQKIGCGGYLAAISFIVAGIIQLVMMSSQPDLPEKGEAQLRVYNSAECVVTGISDPSFVINPQSIWEDWLIDLKQNIYLRDVNMSCPEQNSTTGVIQITNGESASYLITYNKTSELLELHTLELFGNFEYHKQSNADPKVKVIYNVIKTSLLYLDSTWDTQIFELRAKYHQTTWRKSISAGTYRLSFGNMLDKIHLPSVTLEAGGVYIILVMEDWNDRRIFTLTAPNNVHILWQLPQQILLSAAEIMFTITTIMFAYTEAPAGMRSIVSALWMLAAALGHLVVLFTASSNLVNNLAVELLVFSGIMLFVMGLFSILALRYKYSHEMNKKMLQELSAE